MCFLTEIIVCVAFLRQKSKVNFRLTKVDAGKLKCKYLNRLWSMLAVIVLISIVAGYGLHSPYILESNPHLFYSFRGLKNQMRIRFAV
jgi:hypothetical protein